MMRCPHHPRREVKGYCTVCGDLGCGDCLLEHKGAYYCKQHFKPIAQELQRKKHHDEVLQRRDRQRLVVHDSDGEVVYGNCYTLNPKSGKFHLEVVDRHGERTGETKSVLFEKLKAVFYVKSYDGRFDKNQQYKDWHPGGTPLAVEFADGEVIIGRTLHPYDSEDPRFHLIPDDKTTNNISVLAETAAIASTCDPNEHREARKRHLESYINEHQAPGVPQGEVVGDFHFTNRDYARALKYYRSAQGEAHDAETLRRKIIAAEYNIGLRYAKHHDFKRALRCMRTILETDPDHEKAKTKVEQIQAIIARGQKSKRKQEAGAS